MSKPLSRAFPCIGHYTLKAALIGALITPVAALSRDNAWKPVEDSPTYRTECSACHIAFPPALLSVDDWLAIMADLDRHFGANASLDAKTRQEISAFLERNGATNRFFSSRDEIPRITTADWFVRKHRDGLRLLKKGRVKSLADCAVCHKGPEIERMSGN